MRLKTRAKSLLTLFFTGVAVSQNTPVPPALLSTLNSLSAILPCLENPTACVSEISPLPQTTVVTTIIPVPSTVTVQLSLAPTMTVSDLLTTEVVATLTASLTHITTTVTSEESPPTLSVFLTTNKSSQSATISIVTGTMTKPHFSASTSTIMVTDTSSISSITTDSLIPTTTIVKSGSTRLTTPSFFRLFMTIFGFLSGHASANSLENTLSSFDGHPSFTFTGWATLNAPPNITTMIASIIPTQSASITVIILDSDPPPPPTWISSSRASQTSTMTSSTSRSLTSATTPAPTHTSTVSAAGTRLKPSRFFFIGITFFLLLMVDIASATTPLEALSSFESYLSNMGSSTYTLSAPLSTFPSTPDSRPTETIIMMTPPPFTGSATWTAASVPSIRVSSLWDEPLCSLLPNPPRPLPSGVSIACQSSTGSSSLPLPPLTLNMTSSQTASQSMTMTSSQSISETLTTSSTPTQTSTTSSAGRFKSSKFLFCACSAMLLLSFFSITSSQFCALETTWPSSSAPVPTTTTFIPSSETASSLSTTASYLVPVVNPNNVGNVSPTIKVPILLAIISQAIYAIADTISSSVQLPGVLAGETVTVTSASVSPTAVTTHSGGKKIMSPFMLLFLCLAGLCFHKGGVWRDWDKAKDGGKERAADKENAGIQEAGFVEKNRKNSIGEEANATTLMRD